MADSIFTKIIKGEIPAHKIYEDDKTLAFLDISPVQEGHTLVVPKVEVSEFQNLGDDDYLALMKTVKKVAERIKQVLNPPRVGVAVVGFDVPHVHIHLLPIYSGFKDFLPPEKETEPDHNKLAETARKLAF